MFLVLICLLPFINSVSTESRLYGPGLRASFQVPVRYFYLESRDLKGRRYRSLFVQRECVPMIIF